jgi:hypothetical protein
MPRPHPPLDAQRRTDHGQDGRISWPSATRLQIAVDDPPRFAQNARTEAERLAPYRRVRDEIREFIATLPEGLTGGATDYTLNKEET